jgi:hypothetical protein
MTLHKAFMEKVSKVTYLGTSNTSQAPCSGVCCILAEAE